MHALRTTLLVSAIFAGFAIGQERKLTIQNLAPFARDEWLTVSVPFAEGTVTGVPEWHVQDLPTVWQPFGARWSDGSVRQALCMFRKPLGSLQELDLTLVAGAGPEVPKPEFGLGPHAIRFVAKAGGKTASTELQIVELLESNAARQVILMRGRLGETGLVAECVLEVYSGQRHAYCGVSVFFSDPSTQAFECQVDEIAIETEGLALMLRHARPFAIEHAMTEKGSRVVLLKGNVIGDGQGLRRTGVLLPPLDPDLEEGDVANQTLRAAVLCRPLGATSWRDSGAFGAFGYVPEPPPWLAGARTRAAFARRHGAFVQKSRQRGHPFLVGPHSTSKTPGQTGDQPDFGIVQLEPVASTGIPSFLYEVEMSILQEACRPVHFFEADAKPVTAANHPQWVVWEGRAHWNHKVSPDRLGKPNKTPRFQTHGWKGKIRSHWSSNYLCAYYLLTGCPQALLEIRNECRLYLAAQTVRPGLSTSTPGASRAVGRTLHTATWLYLCTGDIDVGQRMIDRVHKVAMPGWLTQNRPETEMRPYAVDRPYPSAFDGKSWFWAAWMDNIAAIGPAAVYEITGDEVAKKLADGLALNTLRYAWRIDQAGTVRVVYWQRWVDEGRKLTEYEGWDPNFVKLSGSVSLWGMPCLEWGRQAAAERGLDDLVKKADDLLARMRRARRPSKDGWFDRFGQWDAVRGVVAPAAKPVDK